MAEQKKEVKTFVVNYECDECKGANMKYTEVIAWAHPPKHIHTCPKCKATRDFTVVYPRSVTEEVVVDG